MRRYCILTLLALLLLAACNDAVVSPRQETLLTQWEFSRDSVNWENVTVPHDWAITGPFDRSNDLQEVIVTQNFETEVTAHTGRTGGLPYMGKGWYRTTFDVTEFDPENMMVALLFDGAMSQAKVRINGRFVMEWPYGYNAFHADVTEYLNPDGKDNLLEVSLENLPNSSRWYPGAGLYRNVHVIRTHRTHVPVWGTYLRTPDVSEKEATVEFGIRIENVEEGMRLKAMIYDADGYQRASLDTIADTEQTLVLRVKDPQRWSPEHPDLYTAVAHVYDDNQTYDRYETIFGIRTFELVPDKGFYLNGQLRKFQGVCNHHDLGPLGAAVNKAALRHQLALLKDMGCDAIRTSHNMPAPELVELCDEMGFMMMVEAFDEWDIAKCENGYHLYFDEWAEMDMVNMIRHFRNNPSVILWGIGNEVPTQCAAEGYKVAAFLQDICHREDPTRLVTAGMDQADCVVANGFAQLLDIVGFNYRTHKYQQAYDILPQKLLLGSETASTVSSRGVYKFPAELKSGVKYADNQCSSYDLEVCWWSNVPDVDFALQDDLPWTIGQFVWTGFDYLGEPTPYDVDAWPSHSSYFGILDLASLPKDRYWLYRSQWNRESPTLHVLPHWTWPGREGEKVPVVCYTSYPMAELFVNGVSQGVARFDPSDLLRRYRLVWPDVIYEPGEIEVVAYDEKDYEMDRVSVRTAGAPDGIKLSVDRKVIDADGLDLAYVTVSIVDADGNLCPAATDAVTFDVSGAGSFRAAANGDATCLVPFQSKTMPAFSGQLTAIVQSSDTPGTITLNATAEGLTSNSITIKTK
jgi:Beta-galactosidase/beta-glucuronidase